MRVFGRYQGDDRRQEARVSVRTPGQVVGPGFSVACTILDLSEGGARVHLDRPLPNDVALQLIDVNEGTAADATVAWRQGLELGLKVQRAAGLRGLVPAKLAGAREAWTRAGGR